MENPVIDKLFRSVLTGSWLCLVSFSTLFDDHPVRRVGNLFYNWGFWRYFSRQLLQSGRRLAKSLNNMQSEFQLNDSVLGRLMPKHARTAWPIAEDIAHIPDVVAWKSAPSWEADRVVNTGGVSPCRYGAGCWRPLCPYRHSGGGRAAMWARVWKTIVAAEEVKDISVEKTVEGPQLPFIDKVNETPHVFLPQVRREIVEVIQPVLVERIKGGVADQMVDIRMPPVVEEIAAVVREKVKFVPQERVQQRTVERAPAPQILEKTVEVALAPTERVQQRTVEQVPLLQILEETIEVARLAPHEGVQQRTVDVPQVLVRLAPRERVQQRTAEQIVGLPQFLEETVEVLRLVPRERILQPSVEGNVDVVRLVPQEHV